MFIESPTYADQGCQGTTFENMLRCSVVSGILTVDSSGEVAAITAEAERVLHLTLPGRQARTLQDLPDSLQAVIREVQTTGRTVTNRPIPVATDSDGLIMVSVSATPSVIEAKIPSVVVMLKEDVSTGRLEDNLHHLDRLASIGTLSASMAHEVKNALVAVRTFVELLLEKDPDADLASIVRREVARVDSIVSQMLRYAAPAQPRLADIRLNEILDHSLRLVQHGAKSKPISFHREFNASPDTVNGDDHQLEQAFVNLLFNAVEATPAEGSLTISTDLIPDEGNGELREQAGSARLMRIKIADTGTGIDPEKLNHIFEPFYTTKQTGTGLGLAVTRRIVQEHKGTIRVESSPGKGSTFIIFLPVGAAANP